MGLTRALIPNVHGDYDPDTSYYALRRSSWSAIPLPAVGLMTYVGSLADAHQGMISNTKKYETYPPAPLTNTVFALLPGRCVGQYVFSRESARFVADSRGAYSDRMLTLLNADEARGQVGELLSRDYRYFNDRPKRGINPVRAVDGYFLPTLFASDWLQFSDWPGYPKNPSKMWRSKRYAKSSHMFHSYDPSRYLTVVLTPWRGWTLCVINHPVVARFDRKGRLEAADFGLAYVKHMLGYFAQLLAECGDPNSSAMASEALGYWQVANRAVRGRDGLKYEAFNMPVPPLEWMLDAVEH